MELQRAFKKSMHTAFLLLLTAGASVDAQRERRPAIIRPQSDVVVAAADYAFYNYVDYSHVTLMGPLHRIRKVLDLSAVPAREFASVRRAQVSLFLYVEDGKGDGLDETFDVIVNGRVSQFATRDLVSSGWGWFNTRLAINWFSFDIPVDALKRGPNEIVVHPSAAAEKGDDRVVLGIDMFQDQECSARSTDGGATWQSRPLNKDAFGGEYMVRLVLMQGEVDPSSLRFSHEDFPPLPTIDMTPHVRPLPPPSKDSPRLTRGHRSDTFTNGAMVVTLHHDAGVGIEHIEHRGMKRSPLRDRARGPIFVLEIEGRRLTGADFEVVGTEVISQTADQVVVVYDIRHATAKISGRIRVRMDRSSELQIGLSLQNVASKSQVVKAAFPVIEKIAWSDGAVQDRYLFPSGAGIVLDHPAEFRSGYGGGKTYFQTMASYCPELGGGLYLRVNDQSGEYKILHMLKTDVRESRPTFRIDPLLTDARNGRAPMELILWEPFRSRDQDADGNFGTSMAFSYFGRDLKPREQWRFANAVVGVMNGDWHEAMQAYRTWFDGFAHKNRYPNKLTDAFNYDSTGPEWGFRGPGDKQAYNTDPTKWGHRVMGHVADDFMTKIVDGLEHSGYWEHEEVTDAMLAEHKATAEKYGVPFKLWPDRHGMLEGKNVLWGNQGDYGLTGYNERWGGLPAFRKYIAALKRRGYIPTFYINKAEAAFGSVMGRAHGPEWATMYPDGQYFWPYSDWQMCMDHQPWRAYLARTCARIIEETGGDGVRIDEMGGASRICQNKKHTHTFARWRHYNELQAQADAARQVRQAMDAVNPDSVLLTESPGFDVLGQYLDGSLMYDLTEQPYTSHVAANWEGFVGINIYRFYFPRHKVFDYQISEKHPEWRLFNATGAFNREWCYREHDRQMLKDNADAFGSLNPEPMIGSGIRRVYVNRFPAEAKTVYTIYNANAERRFGTVLSVPAKASHHAVDIYRYENVETTTEGDATDIAVDLPARAVTCVAVFHELLDLRVQGGAVLVKTRHPMDGATVRIANLAGATVAESKVEGRQCELQLPRQSGRLICKLYDGKYVVDALPISQAAEREE